MTSEIALLLIFLLALATSLLLVPLAGRMGERLGFVDRPRSGELQRHPIARTGGYAVVAATAVGIGLALVALPRPADEWPRLLGLAIGTALLLPLAFLDDWKRLQPAPQFLWQVVVAIVTVWFGITVDSISSPFGGVIPIPALLVGPVTVFWIVGMVNTINLTDTMDGLAGGVATIAALVLAAVSLQNGQHSIAALPLALAGGVAGFLVYNFYPARIIMGSSGSLLIGYGLAVMSIIGGAKLAAAMMVLGLPILDVAWVIVYRVLHGRSPLRGGDGAHLSHKLVAMGLSQRRVALLLYAACLLFGALALLLTRAEKLVGFALLSIVALTLMVVAARHGSPPHTDASAPVPQPGEQEQGDELR